MGGLAPDWVWWSVGVVLAVFTEYLVLSTAIELLIKRWSRLLGCPVCGAGRRAPAPGGGEGTAERAGEGGGH